jgi:hypothetical protein
MGALTLCKLITDELRKSDDPFIESLVNYLKPLYSITVKANKANSGDITLSNSFPEGTPITVKVLPSSGAKFLNWNQDSKNVSTKTLHRFTMGAKNTELTAVFEGGDAVDTIVKINFPEGKKRVAYITDPNGANYANDTKILPMLKTCEPLFVYEVDATKTNVDLADFDLIVISEVAASTATRIASLKSIDKPTLTMKVHAYKEANGAWGWAKNGFGDNYEATSIEVTEQGKNHPIFTGVDLNSASELQIVSEVNNKALTYMNPADFTSVIGGDIVELATITGEEQCNIFEVPAGTSIAGSTLKSTMIQIGLNSSSYANITEAGTTIIKNACYYLLDLPIGSSSPTDCNVVKVESESLSIYPNPVLTHFTISLISDIKQDALLLLYNINGGVILTQNLQLTEGENHLTINRNNIPEGIYLLKMEIKNKKKDTLQFINKIIFRETY